MAIRPPLALTLPIQVEQLQASLSTLSEEMKSMEGKAALSKQEIVRRIAEVESADEQFDLMTQLFALVSGCHQ